MLPMISISYIRHNVMSKRNVVHNMIYTYTCIYMYTFYILEMKWSTKLINAYLLFRSTYYSNCDVTVSST